jgi:hypothetical protein
MIYLGANPGVNLPIATQAQAEGGIDNTTIMTPLRVQQNESMWGSPEHGRLVYVSPTLLRFMPFKGNLVKVNGKLYTIPSAGIPIPNTNVIVNNVPGSNLVPITTYLVGLIDNGSGTLVPYMTLGGSHSTSTTPGNAGVEIANAGDIVSIIGMAYTSGGSPGGQFQENGTDLQCVLSWFNRRNKTLLSPATSIATSSASYVNVTTLLWILNWGDEGVAISTNGIFLQDSAPQYGFLNIGQNGAPVAPQMTATSAVNNNWYNAIGVSAMISPAEGIHYFTGLGGSSSGTTTFNLFVTGMTRG